MERMPVVFVGHGSPMNAVEDNPFSRAWELVGRELPRPKGILCISAHWETDGPRVTSMRAPRMIYDFYGFPPELYAVRYPAPGSPELAGRVQQVLGAQTVQPDLEWGLDHGSWSVLRRLFPAADVPVVQLSLDIGRDMQRHYDLGGELGALREEGILVVGSGNLVHNLGMIDWDGGAFDWAGQYDALVRQWILEDDHPAIIHYEQHGRAGLLSVNSAEHYKPLLYVLALKRAGEQVRFFNESVIFGSLSMRGLVIG